MKKMLVVMMMVCISKMAAENKHEKTGILRALCAHELSSSVAYTYSMDLCMQIWTELDLLGAIRTSTEDLMYFADQMIDKFLKLQNALKLVKHYHKKDPYNYEDIENICDLTRQIDDRFYDIFSTITSKEVVCCSVLLERLHNQFEAFTFKSPS